MKKAWQAAVHKAQILGEVRRRFKSSVTHAHPFTTLMSLTVCKVRAVHLNIAKVNRKKNIWNCSRYMECDIMYAYACTSWENIAKECAQMLLQVSKNYSYSCRGQCMFSFFIYFTETHIWKNENVYIGDVDSMLIHACKHFVMKFR
jgi:hypothetical protein